MTTADFDAPAPSYRREVPAAVQILSTLLFGGFAITATALAFVHFWPAGVVLALLLGWRGGFVPQACGRPGTAEIELALGPRGPEPAARRSGNASFDAYRSDILARLEQEQNQFDGFLGRLRDAKDLAEFDRFMDDRARQNERKDEGISPEFGNGATGGASPARI